MNVTHSKTDKNQQGLLLPAKLPAGWIAFIVCFALVFSATSAGAMSIQGDGGLPYFTKGSVVKVEAAPSGATLTVKTYDGLLADTVKVGSDGTATLDDLLPGYYEVSDGSKSLPFVITFERKSFASVVSLAAHLSEDWMYKPGYSPNVRKGRIWGSETTEIFKKDLMIARHSGAYYLREMFDWPMFEPEPGKWTDEIYQYYYLPELEAGFKLIPEIEEDAGWAAAIPGMNFGPPKQDAWKKLFATLSSRYGEKIPIWQVFNEPNPGGWDGLQFPGGATPAKYIEAFAKGARAGVDASGRKLKLVLGGSGISATTWNRDIISEGVMKYMDIFDLHLYGTEPFTFEPAMKVILKELDQVHFSGPIMATEFDVTPGYGLPKPAETDSGGETVNTAPDKLAQMYTLWFSLDRRMREGTLFKYDERDYLDFDCKMGIARLDYSPKPDFAAMNLIAYRLAGASYLKTVYDGSMGPKVSMQLIKDSDGKPFGTVYGQGESNAVTFRTDSPEITLLPAAGGIPVKIRTLGGVAVLPLPNERFFYIDGLKTIDECNPIVEVIPPATSAQNADNGHSSVKLLFRNPLANQVELKVKLTGNKDVAFPGGSGGMTLRLAGLEQREVLVPVLNGSPAPAVQKISVAIDETHYGFHADVPLFVVVSK